MFRAFRSPLSIFAACKARDTFTKLIYAGLFQLIVFYINRSFGNVDNSEAISILDIAGFGKYLLLRILYQGKIKLFIILFQHLYAECFNSLTNKFEQFCINYSNEKIQNFCTQRLIRDEQNWYKTEGIEVPEIPFPGNDIVLGKYFFLLKTESICLQMLYFSSDMFENKTFGIFTLLDEECRMPNPQIASFIQKVNTKYVDCSAFSLRYFDKNASNCNKNTTGFIIRHFEQKVHYSVVKI